MLLHNTFGTTTPLREVHGDRVVKTSHIVIQPHLRFQQLTGVAVFCGGYSARLASIPKGGVLDGRVPTPVLVGSGAGTAKVVC